MGHAQIIVACLLGSAGRAVASTQDRHPLPPACGHGWALNSQEDVLELATSKCKVLNGSLYIGGGHDLRPLAGLRKINGDLAIRSTRELRSLDGLGSLEELGVSSHMGDGTLWFDGNYALESIAALRSLRALPGRLTVINNPVLETLAGLENLRRIGGGLSVRYNGVLRSLSGLRGLRGSLSSVIIADNPALTSLDGLQGASSGANWLQITNNYRLESLQPLAAMRFQGDIQLEILQNQHLLSLDGLEGVRHCSGVLVRGNPRLRSLRGLRNLGGNVSGRLEVSWNDQLSSLRGLEGVRSIGSLDISSNAMLRSLAALNGVRGVGTLTVVSNPELRSLHGLQRLTAVDGASGNLHCIMVNSNGKLESVEALFGVFGRTPAVWKGCWFQFRQQQPLASFHADHIVDALESPVQLSPSPRCFASHERELLLEKLGEISNVVLPAPRWDNARCRECEPCGTQGGLPVHCDLGSGRCRCPLGSQGAGCASPAPRVLVLPGQRFACARPLQDVAIDCTLQIRLRRKGPGGAPPLGGPWSARPSSFSVHAAGGGALTLRSGNGSSHEAVWANATHGSIRVSLWSSGRGGGGPSAALELSVGYLPDVQPAEFLEGTLPSPSPALENTIFPWCVDSEDCALIAPQRIQVRPCPLGEVASEDGAECVRCAIGRMSSRGECEWDWMLVMESGGALALMLVGFMVLTAQLDDGGLRALLAGSRGRRIPVHDVSRDGERVLLSTWGKHHLRMWSAKSFRVRLTGTGPDQLELLGARGEPLRPGGISASQGFVQLPLELTALHTGWPLPVACSGPALLAASGCWLAWLSGWHLDDEEGAPLCWALSLVGVALACNSAVFWLRGRREEPTPLQKHLRAYDARRTNGPPVRVARGAERAVSAGQLVDLHDYFQEFVRDRDMYYVVANLVKPLTATPRLSFAEYVGPWRLAWFASHFWGTSFRHFCTSIRRHAEAVGDWENQAYWICSFSINQHEVEEEVGANYRESSFYLSLWSGSCRGTCMVIDEQALPLTRSWCLFELLQTMELERQGVAGFEGLFFCSGTGVLNSGRASLEASMALGRRLAGLLLEDASASVEADKAMIDGLVVSTMGGFDAMNRALRSRISAVLKASEEKAARDFELLQRALTA